MAGNSTTDFKLGRTLGRISIIPLQMTNFLEISALLSRDI
jgi:hypothetical protein